MTVELPANYKNGSSAYTGTVTAKSTYLNPDNESFPTEMPGDLTTNSNGQLVSLGMVAVELTGSNGEKLQLADGETAKLSFPVPGNAKETPATMPLWSFNESTGLWEKEGDATYDATNKVYVGTVSHFSWHNLDYEMARATLNVKVVNSAGTALYDVPVDIDGQRKVYTNKDGIATCVVPSNTKLYVRVKSEDYGNYAMDYSSGPWGTYDESKEAKLTGVTLAGQETKTVELKINARAPRISGNIINEGSGSKVCTVYLTYGTMQQTEKVVSDLEGAFITYGPANYTGKGKVVALFGDGTLAEQEFDLDGTDKVVNVKVNTSSTGGAGIIQVTGVSENFKFNYSFTSAFKGQYYMDGSTLSFSATDMPENISKDVDPHTMSFHYIYFKIDNYEAGKSEYMLENFSIMREGHGGGHMNIEGSGEIKAAITQNGDSWTLKFSGVKANLYDEVRNISQAQITFDGELTSTVTKSSRE